VTQTLETLSMAAQAGYASLVSHRSGATGDTFIADLAVAANTGQSKSGAPARSERLAKYNRLMAIETQLGDAAHFAGTSAFPRLARR
jgi:enolase